MALLSAMPKLVIGKKKRLGRGNASGKGAKSSRGTTRHQSARQDIKLSFEGGQGKLTKRFPLLRGKGRNKSRKADAVIVTLDQLNTMAANTEVTVESLLKHGLLSGYKVGTTVKILSSGKLDKPLTITLPVSKKAREIIEKSGGKIVV
jgi:large subunit ribosomal protein L15